MSSSAVAVYVGEALAAYGFGHGHPFGPDRMDAFWQQMVASGLDRRVRVCAPRQADEAQILRFHTAHYLAQVKAQSKSGTGYLDAGDTPAFQGIYEAAATVVGTVLAALDEVVSGLPARFRTHRRAAPCASRQCRRLLRIQRLWRGHRDAATGVRRAAPGVRGH